MCSPPLHTLLHFATSHLAGETPILFALKTKAWSSFQLKLTAIYSNFANILSENIQILNYLKLGRGITFSNNDVMTSLLLIGQNLLVGMIIKGDHFEMIKFNWADSPLKLTERSFI